MVGNWRPFARSIVDDSESRQGRSRHSREPRLLRSRRSASVDSGSRDREIYNTYAPSSQTFPPSSYPIMGQDQTVRRKPVERRESLQNGASSTDLSPQLGRSQRGINQGSDSKAFGNRKADQTPSANSQVTYTEAKPSRINNFLNNSGNSANLWSWIPHLPQSADDKTVISKVKDVFFRIEQIVDNFYEDQSRFSVIEAEMELGAFQFPYLMASSLSDCLCNAGHPTIIIKHCLTSMIVDMISADHNDRFSSLLPQALALPVRAFRESETEDIEIPHSQAAFSAYRLLSSYILPAVIDNPLYLKQRNATADKLSKSINSTFLPWSSTNRESDELLRVLAGLFKKSAELGVFLFSQSSTFLFDWTPSSTTGRLAETVLHPRMLKIFDEDAKVVDPAQVMINVKMGNAGRSASSRTSTEPRGNLTAPYSMPAIGYSDNGGLSMKNAAVPGMMSSSTDLTVSQIHRSRIASVKSLPAIPQITLGLSLDESQITNELEGSLPPVSSPHIQELVGDATQYNRHSGPTVSTDNYNQTSASRKPGTLQSYDIQGRDVSAPGSGCPVELLSSSNQPQLQYVHSNPESQQLQSAHDFQPMEAVNSIQNLSKKPIIGPTTRGRLSTTNQAPIARPTINIDVAEGSTQTMGRYNPIATPLPNTVSTLSPTPSHNQPFPTHEASHPPSQGMNPLEPPRISQYPSNQVTNMSHPPPDQNSAISVLSTADSGQSYSRNRGLNYLRFGSYGGPERKSSRRK